MSRTTLGRRSKLMAALLSVALIATLFGAGNASAFDSVDGDPDPVMTADSTPEVFRTENDNEAGDWTIFDPDSGTGDFMVVETGDQIVIEIDDAFGENCNGLASAERIGFSGVPTVGAPSSGVVEFDVEIRASSAGNVVTGTPCDGFAPATLDQVVITVTQAEAGGSAVSAISISDVLYDVGGLADVGFVVVNAVIDDAVGGGYEHTITTGEAASNAYVSNLEVSVGAGIAITPGANRPAPSITLRETEPDATTPDGTVGGICVVLQDDVVEFVGTPTVATTVGNDVASAPTTFGGSDTLRFTVTDGAPSSESTFVISNIRVNTTAGDFGAEHIQVFQCDETDATVPVDTSAIVPGDQTPLTPAPDLTDVDAYTTNERIFVTVVRANRYAGLDRNETAQAIADRTFSCADNVIVARNDEFPDALAGNYVAGQLYAPILLTATGQIPPSTLESLRSLGAMDVFIMGGTTAVSQAVETQLDNTTSYECGGGAPRRTPEDAIRTLNVVRVGGLDRFATARLAALFGGADEVGLLAPDDDTDNPLRTAILANGRNFPDALTAGPMAYTGDECFDFFNTFTECQGFPLVLSDGAATTLPTSTQSALLQQEIQQVIIVGGTDAVPTAIQTGLEGQGIRVIRLAGTTRQGTAVAIANFGYDTLGWACAFPMLGFNDPDMENVGFFGLSEDACPNPIVTLARGDAFPDALTMGPHAGTYIHPILLTENPNSLGAVTSAYLAEIGNPEENDFGLAVFRIDIAGGTAAVSVAVAQAALNALGGV